MHLTESQINPADAKAVFKTASEIRTGKPSGFGRIFKGLRKDKVELSDLQKAWQSEGYPDDTRDISAILVNHGFDKKEINKVFSQVFGKQDGSDGYDEPVASETIQRIAKYAKENGFAEELKSFLSKEFGFKESADYGKAMVEDVRAIFTAIVNEERFGRQSLIKQQEQTYLGRSKK